jgi:hypothetical protein
MTVEALKSENLKTICQYPLAAPTGSTIQPF